MLTNTKFHIKKALKKTFPNVSNKNSPILITRVLSNEWWNIHKKIFCQSFLKLPDGKRENKESVTT